ncbi:dihydrolipoyl dehydrogenase [Mycoplasma marinum]|uniref:Dihydrolipoyl dehydrogenase n=1 Tax=Mycoplasma marinum TaxID=1937190 RepID=A0A4R0XQN1_9MOLU|nr:dihydrolipoyl dehydrogenase [Mycoplasma marinum]TCG11898.1 dihydrolipoyl dehydrogenase [Mycoplasma marinum]
MYKFKFADIGEGLHEGLVGEIYVKVGDEVKEGDSLFSVETDKMTSDIPSPTSGKVTKILIKEEETVHVGDETFYIEDGATSNQKEEKEVEEEKPQEAASVVGSIEVSNDLFSFDSFKKTKSNKKPVENKEEVTKSTSSYKGEKGKEYKGKIEEEFDVIVVGSGPGGYLAAEEVAKHGKKTLIVEKEFWGGVCLNVGCIPTKTLLKSIEVYEYAQQLEKYGIKGNIHDLAPDWVAMQKRKMEVVKKLTSGVQMLMKANNAKTIFGEAKFVGAHSIEIDGKVYKGENIIIATGSVANRLPLEGFEEGYKKGKVITSKEAINLKKLPKTITIIGGGVIGVEFAQLFAANGVKVTILQNLDKILNILDKDIIKELTKELKKSGVEILTNVNVKKFAGGSVVYELDGKEQKISSDLVLESVGRKPLTNGLEEVGIKLGERKNLEVDYKSRTNVDKVYGIGDVTGQAMLAHVAYKHAIIAARHIVGKPTSPINANTIPACIYTHPEVASVGLTEQQAKEGKRDYFIIKGSMMTIGKALADGDSRGFIKMIVDKEYGEIIGAHLVGKHSTDMITEITVAIDSEMTVNEIANTIHPHPTVSEIIWETARKAVLELEKSKK